MQAVLARWIGILAAAGACAAAVAQPQKNLELSDAIRVEASVASPLLTPTRPVWVRCLLHNDSDAPISIPAPVDGAGLPLRFVLGDPNAPRLHLGFDGEDPVAIPAFEDLSPVDQLIELAPHSTIGRSIDLQTLYKRIRYVGDYELIWTPIEGVPPARVEFRIEPRKQAILVTDRGKVAFELFYDEAPRNVHNFLDLARRGFYDGKIFHRIVPGFAAQGGCPEGDGTGVRPDERTVPAEIHDAEFELGTLAMATKPGDPDSASCQFFITLGRAEALDGKYTVIGQATDEASLRTLQDLNVVRTDDQYHPLNAVVIRSFNLVPSADRERSQRLELRGRSGENLGRRSVLGESEQP